MPKAKDALLAIKHFPRPVVETWGDAILDLLSTVRKMDTDALVGGSVREESNQDRSRIDAACLQLPVVLAGRHRFWSWGLAF